MTTETTKPEAIITPYEPAEDYEPAAPLPGVAPELRHDAGGYWRSEAGRDGEPDWKAEAKRTLPCGHHASLALRSVESATVLCELCDAQSAARDAEAMEAELRAERDALRAEVERLKAAAVAVRESVECWRDALVYEHNGFASVTRGAIQHFVVNTVVDRFGLDRETAGNAPLARNDGADGKGAAQEGAERIVHGIGCPAPFGFGSCSCDSAPGDEAPKILSCEICLKVPTVMSVCVKCDKGICARCSIAVTGKDAVDAVCLRCRETDGEHSPEEFINALEESDLPVWATERAIQMQTEALAFTDAILPAIGDCGLHEDFVEAVKRVISERDRFLAELNQRRADAAQANADYLRLRQIGQHALDKKNVEARDLRGLLRTLMNTTIQLAPYPPDVAEAVVAIVGVVHDALKKNDEREAGR